jgi:hypothetical protein
MRLSNDKAHNARVGAAYERCMQAIAENGWGFYRANNAFHDKLMGLLSYNDHVLPRQAAMASGPSTCAGITHEGLHEEHRSGVRARLHCGRLQLR